MGEGKTSKMDGVIDLQKQQQGVAMALPTENKIDIIPVQDIHQQQGSTSLEPDAANFDEALENAVTQKAFLYSANLTNLLPTGTLLAFQILVPIFVNDGVCNPTHRYMTAVLLIGFGISCFMVCFTDSFKGSDGKIYYGLTTPRGLWTFQYVNVAVPDSGQYKLSLVDFVHAIMSVLVFITIALFNESVVTCFWSDQGEEAKQALRALPIGIGFFASVLFAVFPTTRHGVGYPVTT